MEIGANKGGTGQSPFSRPPQPRPTPTFGRDPAMSPDSSRSGSTYVSPAPTAPEAVGSSAATSPERSALESQRRSGAQWFYWIAGLSVINSVIYITGSDWSFLAGLGLTQLAEGFVDVAIENGVPGAFKIVAIIFNLILVGAFALFGYYANKRFSAAFIVGIVLYVLDGLLLLLLGVLLSAGFHAFALFFIIRGFLACRELNAIDSARTAVPIPPPSSATA